MKIHELEKDNEYINNKEIYLLDKYGYLHIKKPSKRNNMLTWFFSDLAYNNIIDMDFEKRDIECKHKDSKGKPTIEYYDNKRTKSSMYCKKCNMYGTEFDLINQLI